MILARLPAADLPADLKAQYEGEALFLRSLFYYYLAQIFCNIPLILDETTTPDQPVNQVPASEVYAQLIQDLTRAEELLPVRYPQGQEGRATKGAAATLLAKVYLIVGDRGRAATVLRRIIDNYATSWCLIMRISGDLKTKTIPNPSSKCSTKRVDSEKAARSWISSFPGVRQPVDRRATARRSTCSRRMRKEICVS